jgi:hypothetical protein
MSGVGGFLIWQNDNWDDSSNALVLGFLTAAYVVHIIWFVVTYNLKTRAPGLWVGMVHWLLTVAVVLSAGLQSKFKDDRKPTEWWALGLFIGYSIATLIFWAYLNFVMRNGDDRVEYECSGEPSAIGTRFSRPARGARPTRFRRRKKQSASSFGYGYLRSRGRQRSASGRSSASASGAPIGNDWIDELDSLGKK